MLDIRQCSHPEDAKYLTTEELRAALRGEG